MVAERKPRLWVDIPPSKIEKPFHSCPYPCCKAVFETVNGIYKHFDSHVAQTKINQLKFQGKSTEEDDKNKVGTATKLDKPVKIKGKVRVKKHCEKKNVKKTTTRKKETPKISLKLCLKYLKLKDVDLCANLKKIENWRKNRDLFDKEVYPMFKEANSSANEMSLRTTLNAKYYEICL